MRILSILLLASCATVGFAAIASDCTSSQYLNTVTLQCAACAAPTVFDAAAQQCSCGAQVPESGSGSNCSPCPAGQARASVGSVNDAVCLPCGGPVPAEWASLNVTVNATVDSTGTCGCPSEFSLTHTLGSTELGFWICGRCTAVVSGTCVVCPDGFVVVDGQCACDNGGYRYDGPDGARCVPSSVGSSLLSSIAVSSLQLAVKNVDNSGTNAPAVASWLLQSTLAEAAVGCRYNVAKQCNALVNLCVLSAYDVQAPACSVYRQLQQLETCNGPCTEAPKTVPWLYYLRSSVDILTDGSVTQDMSLDPQSTSGQIRLVVARYSLNGTFLGHERVVDLLDVCDIGGKSAAEFFHFGADRSVECDINPAWFTTAGSPVFFDTFLDVAGALVPIPVLPDYTTRDIDPAVLSDSSLFRSAAANRVPVAGGYVRRAVLFDNVATKPDAATGPSFVSFLRRVVLVVSLQRNTGSGRIDTPLLVLQYASSAVTAAPAGVAFPETKTVSEGGIGGGARAKYVQDDGKAKQAGMICTIVLLCFSVLTAAFQTWSWSRRQQDLMLGPLMLFRFAVYYLDHAANLLGLYCCVCSGFLYLFYKHQSAANYIVPEKYWWLFAPLYTAAIAKLLAVCYAVHEQCNADVVVVDWERPKAQQPGTGQGPVSMWRSTFVANEFNELQTKRGWNVLLTMLIVLALLEGARLIHLGYSVPSGDLNPSHASYDPVLRCAVCAFLWVVVALFFYIAEHQVYYRFITPHPLQAFVDLCSVSNISLLVLLEPQWGFYIHGQSIHASSDVSIDEFQANLKAEAEGNMPRRGLGGVEHCQTFEIFVGAHLRQFLYAAYNQIYVENGKALRGEAGPLTPQQHRRCFDFIRGGGVPQVQTEVAQHIKRRINEACHQSVRAAEMAVNSKAGLHALIGLPPNVLYMNGAYSGDRAGTDLYFTDDVKAYGKSLLLGLEFDLFVLYLLLFLTFDSALTNTFAAAALTYVFELGLVFYREREGQANLGTKTLLDDRFFL